MTEVRQRKITTIWDNLKRIPAPQDPDQVRRSDRLRKYFAGAEYDQHRLIDEFNRNPAFACDGIKLKPQDVPAPSIFTPLELTPEEWRDSSDEPWVFGWRLGG